MLLSYVNRRNIVIPTTDTIPKRAIEPKNKQPIINIVVLTAIVESGSLR